MNLSGNRSSLLRATLAGALVYVVGASLRSVIYHSFSPKYWFAPIDAAWLYVIVMLAGIVAGHLCTRRILLAGALAGMTGELAHGLLKYVVFAAKTGWEFPPHLLISQMILNELPASLLAAAGAALGTFIFPSSRNS
jgi:hypothetical protein